MSDIRQKYSDIVNDWLLWQPEEPDDAQSLTELLLRVRRETVEECARVVESMSFTTDGILLIVADHIREVTGDSNDER